MRHLFMVPLAEMHALEVQEGGRATIKWGEEGSEEAAIRPKREPLRSLRVLERNLRMQAPAMVLHLRSDGHLIEKFALPEDAKLLQTSHASIRTKLLGGIARGRVYVFSTHLCLRAASSPASTHSLSSSITSLRSSARRHCRILTRRYRSTRLRASTPSQTCDIQIRRCQLSRRREGS